MCKCYKRMNNCLSLLSKELPDKNGGRIIVNWYFLLCHSKQTSLAFLVFKEITVTGIILNNNNKKRDSEDQIVIIFSIKLSALCLVKGFNV